MIGRIPAAWSALPGVVRGPLLMTASVASFSAANLVVKFLGNSVPALEVTFIRFLLGWVTIGFFLPSAGLGALRTTRAGAYFWRGLLSMAGTAIMFYALTVLPLAEVTVYNFTRGLFLVVLAALLLGERLRWRRITATIIGFIGVVVAMRPQAGIDPMVLLVLLNALMGAIVWVLIKKMMRTEAPFTVLFYHGMSTTLLALVPALYVWVTPSPTEWLLLIVIGILSTMAQSFQVRAFRVADATVLSPLDYLQLFFSSLFGFLFFAELPGLWTWIGAALIVAANIYITLREHQLRRQVAA